MRKYRGVSSVIRRRYLCKADKIVGQKIAFRLNILMASLVDSANVFALSSYANLLMMSGNRDKAFGLLNRCLSADPKNSLCWGNLASYHISKGAFDEADNSVAKCLASDPNDMFCLFHRGSLYLNDRNYSKALEIFEKMLVLEDGAQVKFNTPLIYKSIALCFQGLGDPDRARENYARACNSGDTEACSQVKPESGSET